MTTFATRITYSVSYYRGSARDRVGEDENGELRIEKG